MSDLIDQYCDVCGIPLIAVEKVRDGRCLDIAACNARRQLITEKGGGWLISPEGVTRIEPKEKNMISDAVYEQVVAELDEVRKEWQRGIHDASFAHERADKAEAELVEAKKELEIRKRELRTCREEKIVLKTQLEEANVRITEYKTQITKHL